MGINSIAILVFCHEVVIVTEPPPLISLSSATQALGQRPASASAAAAPVRAMPQYKYAAGVRNPQQHMASQPQVAMQQVSP